MSLKVITPSTNLPVELSEMKAHLYIVGGDDDTELANKIYEVQSVCENFTHRSFLNATYEYSMDSFPDSTIIYLPKPPLVSVSKVEYYDTNGTLQEMDLTDFFLYTKGEPGKLVLKPNKSYPSLEEGRPGAVIITFVAGYGATHASLPRDLKTAMKLLVASNWENRQEDFVIQGVGVKSLPAGAWFTLWSYKCDKL